VRYSEVDINRHVNNAHYVAWVEDAVGSRLSAGERLQAIEINYLSEARMGDRVLIGMTGGPGGADLLDMVREEDGARLALAKVEWAPGGRAAREGGG
jgi:acyl-ACP thioesterase